MFAVATGTAISCNLGRQYGPVQIFFDSYGYYADIYNKRYKSFMTLDSGHNSNISCSNDANDVTVARTI